MTTPVRIYHNPRCSKSRAALALLQDAGLEPDVIEYLKTPPSRDTLAALVKQLGIKPIELLRRGESIFREHYADRNLDDDDALDAMVVHPVLIERPIVVVGERAVIGRPPERVQALMRDGVPERH